MASTIYADLDKVLRCPSTSEEISIHRKPYLSVLTTDAGVMSACLWVTVSRTARTFAPETVAAARAPAYDMLLSEVGDALVR